MDKPNFRRRPDGILMLVDTEEAKKVKISNRGRRYLALLPGEVHKRAVEVVKKVGGNFKDRQTVLSQYQIQFGDYKGQPFKWMPEHCLGYSAWLVDGMKGEKKSDAPLSQNKFAFKEYIESYPEGLEAIAMKAEEKAKKRERLLASQQSASSQSTTPRQPISASQLAITSQPTTVRPSSTTTSQTTTVKQPLTSSATLHALLQPAEARRVKRALSKPNVQPRIPVRSPTKTSPLKTSPLVLPPKPITSSTKPATKSAEVSSLCEPSFPSESLAENTPESVALTSTTKSVSFLSKSMRRSPSKSEEENSPSTSSFSDEMRDDELYTAAEELESSILSDKTYTISSSFTTPATGEKSPLPGPCKTTIAREESVTAIGVSTTASKQSLTASVKSTTASGETRSEKISAGTLLTSSSEYPLPEGWKESLPEVDHQWISKALFHWSKAGKPELDIKRVDKLWWYPPQPSLTVSQPPGLDRYFAHRFLLWMPRKLWDMKLVCLKPECQSRELTSAGLYKITRQVVDLDGFYNIATEYLECGSCKKKVSSWSDIILQQLDAGHRSQFPAVLTYRLACDMKVIRLLRQRGLGNSSTQLQRKLEEQHGEAWLQKTIQYMTDCEGFIKAFRSGLVTQPLFKEPPPQMPVPGYKWILTVYTYDVLQRLDVIKATITSTFGRVLKMDSTKKVVKKLAGDSFDTATWATNIGNEHGQVLMSVLTASEGVGLEPMVKGIIERYKSAEVDPPDVIYIDRDCCGESAVQRHFSLWPDIEIRLDIWHFMRRFSAGVTTDAHRLYSTFMSRLSQCIFKWDKQDLDLLKEAKRSQMEAANVPNISDTDIIGRLSRKELALHCRRTTRGAEETVQLLQQLLEAFDSAEGRDVMGVPLLDHDRIWNIWESQKKHVACIQDPKHFQLYTQTGVLKKGSVKLPVYRCARGSTSLESFHLHLNRFIPGTSANATHFQAYLLEGLVRWNEDRAQMAMTGKVNSTTYTTGLKHTANKLADSIFQQKVFPDFITPRKYTGEKIGVEYLYSQSGKALQETNLFDPDSSEAAAAEEKTDEDEGFMEGDIEVDDETIAIGEMTLSPQKNMPRPASPKQKVVLPILSEEAYADMLENRPSFICLEKQEDSNLASVSTITTPMRSTPVQTIQTPITTSFPAASATITTENVVSTQQSDVLEQNLEESVGPDNIEGYGRVEALAEYLVSFVDKSTNALTNGEASRIIELWDNLLPYDKAPTKWPERFKNRLDIGTFKKSKKVKTTVAPGVESTKRCFVGQNSGPSQWPNCNRYVEAIMIRLCGRFPLPLRQGRKTIQRWSLILDAYKKIQQMVLGNKSVTDVIRIQLFDVNQHTISKWYIKREKKREEGTVVRGLPSLPALATATEPLPPPVSASSVATFSPAKNVTPYMFINPANTAGEASKAKRSLVQPSFPLPVQNITIPGLVLPPRSESVPYSTLQNRKRKMAKENEGQVFRKYVRKSGGYVCGKCGKERTADGHKQHYGNWFCMETSTVSYEEWLKALTAKGYGRKKKLKEEPSS